MDPELVNDWNEGGSKPRRTELNMLSKMGIRKYDSKTTMTTASENDGV